MLWGVVGLLSTLAGIWALAPRLTLDITGSRGPTSPMQTVFALSNDGLLSVHDVEASCDVQHLADIYGEAISNIAVIANDAKAETLAPGQKMSLPCDRVIGDEWPQIVSADMIIRIAYRPDFVWWIRHTDFHVVAQKTNDGNWLWRRMAK